MMHELFMSPFFGIGLSIAAFWVGTWIRKKTGLVLCNPLVLAIVIVSGVLLIFKIPYEEYNEGGALINMFLAPATACLAVSESYNAGRAVKEKLASHRSRCVLRISCIDGERAADV